MLYFRRKLAGSSHILTKFMYAQRRTALIFVTQGVGCASCMCDWGVTSYQCCVIAYLKDKHSQEPGTDPNHTQPLSKRNKYSSQVISFIYSSSSSDRNNVLYHTINRYQDVV